MRPRAFSTPEVLRGRPMAERTRVIRKNVIVVQVLGRRGAVSGVVGVYVYLSTVDARDVLLLCFLFPLWYVSILNTDTRSIDRENVYLSCSRFVSLLCNQILVSPSVQSPKMLCNCFLSLSQCLCLSPYAQRCLSLRIGRYCRALIPILNLSSRCLRWFREQVCCLLSFQGIGS